MLFQGSSKPPVKWRWDVSYPSTFYPHLYKVLYFHSSGKTTEEIERFIMAVRGAEMLGAASFIVDRVEFCQVLYHWMSLVA